MNPLELKLLDIISELEDDNDRAEQAAKIAIELARESYEAGQLWERYQYRAIDSALDFDQFLESKGIK